MKGIMNRTAIPFLTHTWNPTHGCNAISEGCRSCWAETMAKRLAGMGARGYEKEDPFKPTFCPWELEKPLRVKKPAIIGVSWMGDLFHDDVEWNWKYKIFEMMLHACWHTFMVLTKRPKPETMDLIYFHLKRNYDCHIIPLPNVWFGVSAENQQRWDKRKFFLDIPAAKHFVSLEPFLSDIDLGLRAGGLVYDAHQGILSNKLDLVIAGCESGPNRRPAKTQWFRDVKNQCVETGTRFFLKQMEGIAEVQSKKWGTMTKSTVIKMPFLDGQIWNALPF